MCVLLYYIFNCFVIFVKYKGLSMNPKHGTNCRPNRNTVPRRPRGKELPCGLSVGSITNCFEPNCYLNYRCPIFTGKHVNPPRDYLPGNLANVYQTHSGIGDENEFGSWFSNILRLS